VIIYYCVIISLQLRVCKFEKNPLPRFKFERKPTSHFERNPTLTPHLAVGVMGGVNVPPEALRGCFSILRLFGASHMEAPCLRLHVPPRTKWEAILAPLPRGVAGSDFDFSSSSHRCLSTSSAVSHLAGSYWSKQRTKSCAPSVITAQVIIIPHN
jgi:hypothetical protein